MFNEIQNGIRNLAESSLIKKLNKEDISKTDLTNEKFEDLCLKRISELIYFICVYFKIMKVKIKINE